MEIRACFYEVRKTSHTSRTISHDRNIGFEKLTLKDEKQ